VHVTSAPGQGTTFQIFLCAIPAPTIAVDAAPRTSMPGTGSILLVEDDEAIRRLLRLWLMRCGYAVVAVGNATEALNAVATRPIVDIVVTDVMMPGMNGPELVKLLQDTRPDLPVLYISGYAHDALTTEGLLPAGTHFLSKPFTNEELHERIRQILAASSGESV
jgi:two-component system cell cycle sensor histidine kinase/response regulator CckA